MILRNKHAGFTLLELMIAMIIFSFMSIMAYGGLINIFKSNEVITSLEKDLKVLKRTMMFFDRDMRQLVTRPRRNGYDSSEFQPALASNLDSTGLLEFTRAGVSNPLELVRSSLQRVRYTLEDKKLKRLSWNLVDHIEGEPSTMTLLDNVESFTLRFLSQAGGWQENWGTENDLPRAVELTLKHEKWGDIKRLILVR